MPSTNAKTARQIIKRPLLDLIRSSNRTTSMAIHNISVVATIYQWNNFKHNVRQQCNVAQLSRRQLAHFPTNFASEHHIANEQLCCGDESSVQARFTQNVCHTMTSIYRDTGILCRFGDARACNPNQNFGGIPDIVLMTDSGAARVVGEMKTPWMHTALP